MARIKLYIILKAFCTRKDLKSYCGQGHLDQCFSDKQKHETTFYCIHVQLKPKYHIAKGFPLVLRFPVAALMTDLRWGEDDAVVETRFIERRFVKGVSGAEPSS